MSGCFLPKREKNMKLARITFKFIMICALLAAGGSAVSAKDDWLKIHSKNFQLVGSASENDLRRVATKLEQFRYVFTQLFPKMNFKKIGKTYGKCRKNLKRW